jgi:hypothetical protein
VSRLVRFCLLILLAITIVTSGVLSQDTATPPQYRLEASVNLDAPYVGQQVVYSVRFYAQRMPEDYEYLAPDFAGWWRGEQIVTEQAEIVDGVPYTIRTYETLIYPLQADALTIPPAQLIIPQEVFSDRAELSSGPVTVAVQPLPDGAPASFTGGVGTFTVSAESESSTVTLGQPLTLRWTLTGAGNLAQIAQPSLQIPDGWRIYADPTTTTSTTRGAGERIFEWRLIPEVAGTSTIAAQTFAYFDPDTAQYVTLDVPEILIDVLPDASGQRELPASERRANRPAALPLKSVTQVEAASSVPLWAWVIPPLIVIATAWGQAFMRQTRVAQTQQRRDRALSTAKNRLQTTSKGNGIAAFSSVQQAIAQYIADKTSGDVQGVNFAGTQKTLVSQEISAESREALALCWLEAEEALYAPAGAIDPNQLLRRTAGVLTEIDQQWNTTAKRGEA